MVLKKMQSLTRKLPPAAIGVAVGAAIAGLWLQGGYDAYYFFFTNHVQLVPAWAQLFVKPISWLGWPYSYALMCGLMVLAVAWAARELGGRWWLVILSMPLWWEIWSGQIDWLVIIGIVLGLWVIDGRIKPIWIGFAWLLMLSKPQAGLAPALLLSVFFIIDLGWRKLLPGLGASLVILLVTFVIYPHWVQDWFGSLFGSLRTPALGGDSNGSIPWPWGLLAWLAVPGARDRKGLLRRVTAAGLLTMPYLKFYHLIVLVVLLENPVESVIVVLTSWIVLLSGNWMQWAFIIPLEVLVLEQVLIGDIRNRWNNVFKEGGKTVDAKSS
jgi:hypothetical protein